MFQRQWIFIFLSLLSLFSSVAFAISDDKLSGTEIHEKLSSKIDLNRQFTDQTGQTLSLKQMFKGKDVLIVSLNYFRCTTMCTFQFINLAEVLRSLQMKNEDRFQIATISFDPTDDLRRAKTSHDIWTAKAGPLARAWNFYTGSVENIEALTKSVNFYYERDDEGNYSHAGALLFIKSDGTFYRYLYGIVYDENDFKQALFETSNGKIGSVWDKIWFHFRKYDPIRGKYKSWI